MKNRFTWLLVLFFSTSGWSQELRLKTAVAEAKQYSPIVQKSRASLDGAYWNKIESYSGFLPSLTGDVNYLLSKKYAFIDVNINNSPTTFPQIIPTSQFLLTGSLPVFDGFSNFHKYEAGAHMYEAAQNEYDWTEFTTEMQTTLLFYRSLVAKNLMDVAEQNANTIEDHYKDILALKKVGVATKFDVLRVEVQRDEAQAEILRTQDEYEFSKIRLAKTMGKDSDARIPVGSFPQLKPSMIDQYDLKQNDRKDLQALSEQSQSLINVQKANGRFWIPKVSLFGQMQAYNNVNDTFTDWDAYRDAYQLGMNLHWNFFDGMTSISKYKQAKAQALVAQNGVRQAALKASEDAEIWKRKFQYYCKLVEVKTAESEKAQEAVRLAKESVRAGTKTNTDFLDAELDFFRSRSDVLNVRMGMVEALINFQMATGKKVYDFGS